MAGVLNWNYTGLTYYEDSWYYVRAGVVDWLYTGLYQYNGTCTTQLCFSKVWYYILNWNYTGPCQYNGTCM